MYRIIVADDEEYVRELLTKNINQTQTEFEVVGKAENGVQAIELVKELNPDILITDICMPFVSGLELIREIKNLEQAVKTVIISGYDDFSYAKQAVSLGVTEYLLKPFLPEELYAVLNKIGEELERQKTLIHNIQDMQSQLEDNLIMVQENFLCRLLQEVLKGSDAMQEAEKARICLDARQYAVGILRIHSSLEEKNQKFKDFLSVVKDEYFSKDIRSYVAQLGDRQIVMIFFGGYRNPQSFTKAVREGIMAIGASMERYYDMNLNGILGGVYESWEQIPTSYKNAMSVWRGMLDSSEPFISYEEEIKGTKEKKEKAWERPVWLENNLLLNIQMGRVEQSLENLEEILKYYSDLDVQLSEFVSISLMELVFDISGALMKAGGARFHVWEDENAVEYLKKHFAYGSLKDAKEVLEEYIKKCCRQFSSINEKQGERIVFNVKKLIDKNIGNEEFNLETASAQMFFSPNYVRQIFKQITGERFTEYLIRRRMETARELLANPVMKIQDVAVETGYSNQRYFASCFKKYYGCTPTEYRNQMKDGGNENGKDDA